MVGDGSGGAPGEEPGRDAPPPGAGGGVSSDLLLGFLNDFRSVTSPPPQAPSRRATAPPFAPSTDTEPETADLQEAPPVPSGPAPAPAPEWYQPPSPPAWQAPQPPYQQAPAQQPPGYWQPPGAGGGFPSQPGSPAGRTARRWRAAVAVAVAVAVVAAGGLFVLGKSSGPSYPSTWDPRVAPIAQFVQSQRGLTWKHPVKVEFLAPTRFDALMSKENAPDPRSTQEAQAVFAAMRALGLASGNVDLAKAAQQFAANNIVGQYVDADRTVYVRGDQLTPYVRSTLAHELTHALQAQYFNLEKLRSGHADDDSAVTALVEGDAVRIQNTYEQTMSQSDQQLLVQEQQALSGQANGENSKDGIPQFMVDQAQFPYDFGPTFVAALAAKGGNHSVDAAFRNPPTLDGQVVDPESFQPGVGAPKVSLPAMPKGARQVTPPSGFGEVTLVEMLGDQVGFAPAWTAVQGWTNDSFVSYRQDGRVCVDLSVLNDSAESATSLAQTGGDWASHLPSASVSRAGSTVNFHACDPGTGWKPSGSSDDPYQDLAVRSVVMYQLITDGNLDPLKASCAADQLMTSLGPQELQAAEQSSDPNSPPVQALAAGVGRAAAECA